MPTRGYLGGRRGCSAYIQSASAAGPAGAAGIRFPAARERRRRPLRPPPPRRNPIIGRRRTTTAVALSAVSTSRADVWPRHQALASWLGACGGGGGGGKLREEVRIQSGGGRPFCGRFPSTLPRTHDAAADGKPDASAAQPPTCNHLPPPPLSPPPPPGPPSAS